MRVYADSSFIVSLYARESHTPVALRLMDKIQTDEGSIFLSDLAFLETTNPDISQRLGRRPSDLA